MNKTEKKIIDAAQKVFQEKGYEGARMREIAAAAGINKGLLHYYFKTKDNLFEAVFREAARTFIPQLDHIFQAEATVREKLEWLIRDYIDFLRTHRFVPPFVIQEINRDPRLFAGFLMDRGIELPNPFPFLQQIGEEVQAGRLRPVDPRHLVVSLISMCVFPFVGAPVIQHLMGFSEREFDEFMEARKTVIFNQIWSTLDPGK